MAVSSPSALSRSLPLPLEREGSRLHMLPSICTSKARAQRSSSTSSQRSAVIGCSPQGSASVHQKIQQCIQPTTKTPEPDTDTHFPRQYCTLYDIDETHSEKKINTGLLMPYQYQLWSEHFQRDPAPRAAG